MHFPTRDEQGQQQQQQRPVLGCVECDFKCTTGNEMSRHIYSTQHGAVKCPFCNTSIVPRGFYASLHKLIERNYDRRLTAPPMAPGGSLPTLLPESSPPLSFNPALISESGVPLTAIATADHAHCSELPGFRHYEKVDFELPGSPKAYGLEGNSVADARSGSASGGSLVRVGHDGSTSSGKDGHSPFRCMECLNPCGSWSKTTKHIDKSGHTFPICVQCLMRLRSFSGQKLMKHDVETGHCGFYGVFYTRHDYLREAQVPRNAYNLGNSYTGLSTLQYKCVCGVSFLHLLHLAEHLRRVHHVTCISSNATCRNCGLHAPLEGMILHLRKPCWEVPGSSVSSAAATGMSTSPQVGSFARSMAVTFSEHLREASRAREGLAGDDGADKSGKNSASHIIEVPGFSGAQFLQSRPLLPPMTQDDVRLMNDAYSISGDPNAPGSSSATTGSTAGDPSAVQKASYTILYQCRECLFLFSNWDKMVEHIHGTGHCSTYCCECKCDLPQLVSQPTVFEIGSATGVSPLPKLTSYSPNPGTVPPVVRSTTLSDHLEHLRRHGDIIGFPTSPSSLEVLVDVNAECYQGSIDPPVESFAGDRVVMVYQCPDEHRGCYKVFMSYGRLVEHLIETGHGIRASEDSKDGEAGLEMPRLSSCYPMVAYRAKFTTHQLCSHFGFVQCPYCEVAVPRDEEELHLALCITRRRKMR